MESKDANVQTNWLHDAKNAHTLNCWSCQGCLINITCAHGNKQAELAWLLLQPDNASSHSNTYKPSCALMIDACSAEWRCLLALKNRLSDESLADDWKQSIYCWYSRCYGNGRFLNPWGLVLQSLHRKYFTMSPVIDDEKRANWNWSGQPINEISIQLFEQQAIFRFDFFSRGKCRKIPRYTGLGNLRYIMKAKQTSWKGNAYIYVVAFFATY